MAGSSIQNSDKFYWHQYLPLYETAFAKMPNPSNIVEFGVFKGASIEWLTERFPSAHVTAFDILPLQPEWPTGPRITYGLLDQAERPAIRASLQAIEGEISLIIEDGSHIPQHQASCLAEGFERLAPGGLYVLEDLHTSHPMQVTFAHHSRQGGVRLPNALNLLLALRHARDVGSVATRQMRDALAHPDFFSSADIDSLDEQIEAIEVYKRTHLPLRCYACHRDDQFDYVNLKCGCGTDLYEPADSMTALVWKKAAATNDYQTHLAEIKRMTESSTFESQLNNLDTSLFAIQPADYEDRVSFLRLQKLVRDRIGRYAHLEVGSDLGASLVPHLRDTRCSHVVSIDPRPNAQWDERGTQFFYPGNSTERMIQELKAHCSDGEMRKLYTFDIDAKDARADDMPVKFASVLIDAEHTNVAAFSDFLSVEPLLEHDAVIVFHDANLVTDAILNVCRLLERDKTPYELIFLPDCVAAIGLRGCADMLNELKPFGLQPQDFIEKSRTHRWDNIRAQAASS